MAAANEAGGVTEMERARKVYEVLERQRALLAEAARLLREGAIDSSRAELLTRTDNAIAEIECTLADARPWRTAPPQTARSDDGKEDRREARLRPGVEVVVRSRFDDEWKRGFEVASVDGEQFQVRRRSDGAILPVPLAQSELQPVL